MKYASAPEQFGIKVYETHQRTDCIFTDLETQKKCLFEDQIDLQKTLENSTYQINTPGVDKERIRIYDTYFDISARNMATKELEQKLQDCLTYEDDWGAPTYCPIPSNEEQWPCVIYSSKDRYFIKY